MSPAALRRPRGRSMFGNAPSGLYLLPRRFALRGLPARAARCGLPIGAGRHLRPPRRSGRHAHPGH
eukprot:3951678-Lingulodinium_polyedra.AAC.1